MTPVIVEFGRPEWQSHLGGDLYSPEHEGDLWWRWCGGGKFWCVLPRETAAGALRLRVEAAPLAPYAGPLMELLLRDTAGQMLARRVTSAGATIAETALTQTGGASCAAVWRVLPPPGMQVFLGDQVVAELAFDYCPEMQMRDFTLPPNPDNSGGLRVVTFQASPAISAEDLGTSQDHRRLAFRLFRLMVV